MLLTYVADFWAGAFICNCIPHLAAGLQGRPFPTPFSTPRGVADSPPLANVVWGMFNVVVGCLLVAYAPFSVGFTAGFGVFLLGASCLGAYVAVHFDRVLRSRTLRNAPDSEKQR